MIYVFTFLQIYIYIFICSVHDNIVLWTLLTNHNRYVYIYDNYQYLISCSSKGWYSGLQLKLIWVAARKLAWFPETFLYVSYLWIKSSEFMFCVVHLLTVTTKTALTSLPIAIELSNKFCSWGSTYHAPHHHCLYIKHLL